MTTWKLTGKPNGAGECEHCGRNLVHRYEVTSDAATKMIVGRGCLKSVTGWTLTAAQAANELRMIEVYKQRAINWAAFEASNASDAATILADCASFQAFKRGDMTTCASYEMKFYVENGDAARSPGLVSGYMNRRSGFAWTR